jgi:hypothetical protein
MKLDFVVSRLRYLALALPLFALSSTIQAGCNAGPGGLYYTTYGPGRGGPRVPSTTDRSVDDCFVYRTGYDGYGGYYGPCDDGDGYGHGGYGGYSP